MKKGKCLYGGGKAVHAVRVVTQSVPTFLDLNS